MIERPKAARAVAWREGGASSIAAAIAQTKLGASSSEGAKIRMRSHGSRSTPTTCRTCGTPYATLATAAASVAFLPNEREPASMRAVSARHGVRTSATLPTRGRTPDELHRQLQRLE